jgi:antitoxin HigA-1
MEMPMKNPPHPGRSLKTMCLDALGLSVTDAAKGLGVARHTLSRVLNGKAGISPEMAIRLEKAGWSNADQWLRVQMAYDLAQARLHESRIKVSLIRGKAA